MVTQLTFDVQHPGDRAAGITPSPSRVQINFLDGDPGCRPVAFGQHMRDCLANWFDGALMSLVVAE